MASKRAIAIQAASQQERIEKLLYALCKQAGINVRDVLNDGMPDFSEPTEDTESMEDYSAGSSTQAKIFKSPAKK